MITQKISLTLLLVLAPISSYAIKEGDGGSRSRNSANDIHEQILKGSFWRTVKINTNQSIFEGLVALDIPKRFSGPLVMNSFEFKMNLQVGDPFSSSSNLSSEDVAQRFIIPRVNRAAYDLVYELSATPRVSFPVGIIEHRLKRASWFDENIGQVVRYNGPAAMQILTRGVALSAANSSREEAILTSIGRQTIPYIGVTLNWWQELKGGGMVGASRALLAVPSEAVGVVRSARDSTLALDFDPSTSEKIVSQIKAIIQEESTTKDGTPIRLDVKRVRPRLSLTLLTGELSTVAVYDMDESLQKEFIAKATNAGTSRRLLSRVCMQLLSARASKPF